MTRLPNGPFDWVDWQDPFQTSWVFNHFSDLIGRERTQASLLLRFEELTAEERQAKLASAKKAWAVQKWRRFKGKPLQIYLSTAAQKYLIQACKPGNIKKDDLIDKILLDQANLHHKEMQNSKKLRAENKELKDQIQRLHVAKIKTMIEHNSVKEELATLKLELSSNKEKSNPLQSNIAQPPETE